MKSSNFVKGATIATIGIVLTKFLGMVYSFPLENLIGDQGGALYQYAYSLYVIFLEIATAGIPFGMAKFVAMYNSKGDYQSGVRLWRISTVYMIIIGIISFIALFLIAPFIAEIYATSSAGSSNINDITYVIRMLAPALIIVPALGVSRGFFQGYGDMRPTAYSQFFEQFVRIVFLLIAAYYIMRVLPNGNVVNATGWVVFASFVGAAAALVVLGFFWLTSYRKIKRSIKKQEVQSTYSSGTLFKKLLLFSLPFVIVSASANLYPLISNATFNSTMIATGYSFEESSNILAIIQLWAPKITAIPVALSMGISLALIPYVTQAYAKKEMKVVRRYTVQSINLILLFTIPAAFGILAVSQSLYTGLYSPSEYGPIILGVDAFRGIFLAASMVTAAVLQGTNQQKIAVRNALIGVGVKLLLNIPMIYLFGPLGDIYASIFALATDVGLNIVHLYKVTHFPLKRFWRNTILTTLASGIMIAVVIAVNYIYPYIGLTLDSRLSALVMTGVSAAIGGVVFLGLAWYFGLLKQLKRG
ncbi:MAG: putative polysaccharide biosynthesis protein [Culicoidibacterales bacterium]